MPDPSEAFDKYVSGSQTTAQHDRPAPVVAEDQPVLQIEEHKYITGKPYRKIVRGRVLHDQGLETEDG